MSSPARKTAWATVPLASSTAMSSVSFGPRSSSQGCWLPSICTSMPSWGMHRRRNRCCWERRRRGTADASLDQNSAQRGTAQIDALAFPQQLGEMSVVGPRITVAGQLHHGGRSLLGTALWGRRPRFPWANAAGPPLR